MSRSNKNLQRCYETVPSTFKFMYIRRIRTYMHHVDPLAAYKKINKLNMIIVYTPSQHPTISGEWYAKLSLFHCITQSIRGIRHTNTNFPNHHRSSRPSAVIELQCYLEHRDQKKARRLNVKTPAKC